MTTISLVVLGIAIYLLSWIPARIDLRYPAVQYRVSDRRESQKINIQIQGKLYKGLWSNPKFVGKLVIDNFGYTSNYQLHPIVFFRGISNGMGSLAYDTVIDGDLKFQLLGAIWISGNFKTLSIEVNHEAFRDVFISAPAKTREDAIRITEALKTKKSP